MSQAELDNLVREVCASERTAEKLASRLKQYNYLAAGVKVTAFRTRHLESI